MTSAIERLPKNTVALTVTVEPIEFQPFLELAANRLSKQKPVPGFRPGRAPFHVMAKSLGADVVFHEAVEAIVSATYGKAVTEQNLETIGPPAIDLLKVAVNNPFVYKATAPLLPEIRLPKLDAVTVERRPVTIDETEVDTVVNELCASRATEIAVARPAQKTDAVEMDFEGFLGDIPVEGAKATKQKVVLGAGHFVPGFEENLIGLTPGGGKEFTVRFPDTYHAKHLAGRDVRFRVTVHAVFQVTPATLDDAFATAVGGVPTVAAFREKLKESIKAEKDRREAERYEREMLEKLSDASTIGDIADSVVDREVDKMMHELRHSVADRHMEFSQYLLSVQKSEDDLRKEFRSKAERRLKTALVIRAIAQAETIGVSDDEVTKEIDAMRTTYAGDADVLKNINQPGYATYLKNTLTTRRVIERLVSSGNR